MAALTIAYVSGLIAAAVFLTQHLVPTTIGLVLVGHLSEEHSIVSWSVINRLLHGSHWSLLLGNDSSASTSVSRRVLFISWFQPTVLSLVGIAGILTPLGLYDVMLPNRNPTPVPFQYAPDMSPFGQATSSRTGYTPVRLCFDTSVGCPGAPPVDVLDTLDPIEQYSVWPANIDLFTSGNVSATVANIFDIEWRSFRASHELAFNLHGSPYSQGVYRQLSTFITDRDIIIAEGVIIDTKSGRIGFRNHTVPTNGAVTAEWTEDILFLEPETQCVDTNITLEYELAESDTYNEILKNISKIALVDQGGFTNLSQTEPDVDSADFQKDPSLYDRAYSLAWHYNMLTMLYLNVTTNGTDDQDAWSYLDSYIGKRFELGRISSIFMTPNSLQTTNFYEGALNVPDRPGANIPNYHTGPSPIQYPNPLNLTRQDFWALDTTACKYPSRDDRSNISFVGVSCGLVHGAGQRIDGKSSLFLEANTPIRSPMYMCATATKAIIRKVKFQFNGTISLSDLRVDSILEKPYNRAGDMPLWGVERLDNSTLLNVRPLWGVVSPEVAAREDISHIQREHLWLPGYPDHIFDSPIGITADGNIPGNVFYIDVARYIYSLDPVTKAKLTYTGLYDASFYSKWIEASRDCKGVQYIMNRIWTDVSANLVVGTKSWLPSSQTRHTKRSEGYSTMKSAMVPIYLISRRIKYKLLYAIPAMIVLGITFLVIGYTIFLIFTRRTGLDKMRTYLSLTSSGRILGSFLYPGIQDPLSPTGEWIKTVGSKESNVAEAIKGGEASETIE